jgi:hypothetical protein
VCKDKYRSKVLRRQALEATRSLREEELNMLRNRCCNRRVL